MYVDIHTGMLKDYGFNWVKFISVKNEMRWICQLESVKVYSNVYRNVNAFSSQTNKEKFKKKKKTYIKIPHNL